MATAQIKQDINRSGEEKTDFPCVCEQCLPENPYVQMLKEDRGAECKICTRPFTTFRWKADRTARTRRTNICLTCARLKNCCQCCMLDLSFGLPIVVRDAALKLVAPGPQSGINREYYAQEHEKEIEDGRGDVEEYEKTDEKARELLRRLANSEPYYKKQRRIGPPTTERVSASAGSGSATGRGDHASGRASGRTRDHRGRGGAGGARGGGRGGGGGGARSFPSTTRVPPGPQDVAPPDDRSITSLFLTGVEDDLPEHELRTFFASFGALRSVICSHRSHCAFINYQARAAAEAAAETCQGKAIVAGCPLRVQWGRPKPLDDMEYPLRAEARRDGRIAVYGPGRSRAAPNHAGLADTSASASSGGDVDGEKAGEIARIALPPGADDVRYASLAGN
ncbi:MAG: Pre-mRNA-splicing factor slt11 [Phylliscum demangeonii]|nr:MAG: Pre-mRNA-splicing factor slt11 [Phylliscum demangeonii]